jgi:hypothetical protein
MGLKRQSPDGLKRAFSPSKLCGFSLMLSLEASLTPFDVFALRLRQLPLDTATYLQLDFPIVRLAPFQEGWMFDQAVVPNRELA